MLAPPTGLVAITATQRHLFHGATRFTHLWWAASESLRRTRGQPPPRPLWERAVSLCEPYSRPESYRRDFGVASLAKPGEGVTAGHYDPASSMRAASASARHALAGAAGFASATTHRPAGHPSPGFPSPICEGQIGEIRPLPQGARWRLAPPAAETYTSPTGLLDSHIRSARRLPARRHRNRTPLAPCGRGRFRLASHIRGRSRGDATSVWRA
jgi:hypothetical protein